MCDSKFRLEEPERRRVRALGGGREPSTDGERPRNGDTDPVSDPLALDPLSPLPVAPGPDDPTGPFALDPL